MTDPAAYPRRILLAVTGLTPQIVTETLYALAVERRLWGTDRDPHRHDAARRGEGGADIAVGRGLVSPAAPVDWVLLGSLVIGSLPGISFGSHLSARVLDKVLRPVLATILVIVGVRMLRA